MYETNMGFGEREESPSTSVGKDLGIQGAHLKESKKVLKMELEI